MIDETATEPDPQDDRPDRTTGVWEKIADSRHEFVGNRSVHCGWGRILFAHTFASAHELLEELRAEGADQRDIAFYVHDPHVLIGEAPHEIFLDPSHTFRFDLATHELPALHPPHGVRIDVAHGRTDLNAVDAILRRRGMVPIDVEAMLADETTKGVTWFLARRERDFEPVGAVMGLEHRLAFDDPDRGSSLWSLAVDPSADRPGIGQALAVHLLHYYADRGASALDLSVVHDNASAIRLYEKLGFQRIPIFCVKRKNPVNEPLFTPDALPQMNPYADIIVREALRRGILVEILDAPAALFRLSFGGRSIVCRESLSEMTSAIAMTRCMDKALTHRLLTMADIAMPEQMAAGTAEERTEFLHKHGAVVVKPSEGEQGFGVHVGIETVEELEAAVTALGEQGAKPIVEEMVRGQDVRTIVIGGELVAASLRKPAQIVGTGEHTITQLIARQSRRREAATGGESRIPIDEETERLVQRAGHSMETVLPEGEILLVRLTANLHSGGTMHDITDVLHPALAAVSRRAAEVLDIPVVGLDLIVDDPERPSYRLLEANERPGLANHEPQPTAERFIELLFPATTPPD